MNLAAIYHRPMSEFAFATSETEYVFRLRTAKNDLKNVKFAFADRATMTPKFTFDIRNMERVCSNKLYDWYEITIESKFERIGYYFELNDGETVKYYYGDGFYDEWDAERPDYFQLPFNLRADRLNVPEWVKDAVVYNIFPDSFADSARHIKGEPSSAYWMGEECRSNLGGTIKGITENLDYIKDLGFNCVYLNPFFVAASYHKYDLIDYFHVDPTRGTDEDFKEMVEKAHKMGMKVIIDGVFNHTFSGHEFFKDVLNKGKESQYFDCFYDLGSDNPKFPGPGEMPEYTCFAYVAHMPKTNTANPFLCDYFCKVGAYWVEAFDVDGWRLDVANEVDDWFLRSFRKAVKSVKEEAVVLGEVWENASHYINGLMMEGAMNYDFRRFVRKYVVEGNMDGEDFETAVDGMFMRYPKQSCFAQLNLLDSHDTVRFMTELNGNRNRMKAALALLYMFPGAPCIFYGTETLTEGGYDPFCRQCMDWSLTKEGAGFDDVKEHLKRLSAIRKKYRLYEGTVSIGEESGMLVFKNTNHKNEIVLLINMDSRKHSFGGTTVKPDGFELFMMIEGAKVAI